MNVLPKSERLHGKTTVSALMSKGRWGFVPGFKYCVYVNSGSSTTEPEANRIMVSVPKRFFKRAVKRNLLKRRIREAYRTSKDLLAPIGADIMFLYNTKEVLDSEAVKSSVVAILKKVAEDRKCDSQKTLNDET